MVGERSWVARSCHQMRGSSCSLEIAAFQRPADRARRARGSKAHAPSRRTGCPARDRQTPADSRAVATRASRRRFACPTREIERFASSDSTLSATTAYAEPKPRIVGMTLPPLSRQSVDICAPATVAPARSARACAVRARPRRRPRSRRARCSFWAERWPATCSQRRVLIFFEINAPHDCLPGSRRSPERGAGLPRGFASSSVGSLIGPPRRAGCDGQGTGPPWRRSPAPSAAPA